MEKTRSSVLIEEIQEVKKGHLDYHRRIHMNEKPFNSPNCNVKFKSSGHLAVQSSMSHW